MLPEWRAPMGFTAVTQPLVLECRAITHLDVGDLVAVRNRGCSSVEMGVGVCYIVEPSVYPNFEGETFFGIYGGLQYGWERTYTDEFWGLTESELLDQLVLLYRPRFMIDVPAEFGNPQRYREISEHFWDSGLYSRFLQLE
jgi:hypothetical protein